jgi:hypothetical protein
MLESEIRALEKRHGIMRTWDYAQRPLVMGLGVVLTGETYSEALCDLLCEAYRLEVYYGIGGWCCMRREVFGGDTPATGHVPLAAVGKKADELLAAARASGRLRSIHGISEYFAALAVVDGFPKSANPHNPTGEDSV